MLYQITIQGKTPLIMHNGATGLDPRSPANLEKKEIASKKGGNRAATDDARLAELECQTALWLNEKGAPTIPAAAIRATIEKAAKETEARGHKSGKVWL